MDVDKFFSKDPHYPLLVGGVQGILLSASLYGSFAVGRPSLLIIVDMMLVCAMTIQGIRLYDMVRGDAKLIAFLDKEGVLVSHDPQIDFKLTEHQPDYPSWQDYHLVRHSLIVERVWNGFHIRVRGGPSANNYRLSYLGLRRWYGYAIRFVHSANEETLLIRDWSSHTDLLEYALRVLDGGDQRGIYHLVRNSFEHRMIRLSMDRQVGSKKKQTEEAKKN